MSNKIIDQDRINFYNLSLFFVNAIWNYKKTYFFTFLLFLIYFFLIATPTFQSKISFYSNYADSSESNFSPILSSVGLSSLDSSIKFSVEDYLESKKLLNELIEETYFIEMNQTDLITYWGENFNKIFYLNPKSFLQAINRQLMYNPLIDENDKKRKFVSAKLSNKISFKEDRRSGLQTIFVETESSELSKQLLENIYESVIDYSVNISSFKAKEKKEFTQKRLAEIKLQLEESENYLVKFYEQNKVINSSPSLEVEEIRLKRNISLNSQLFNSLSNQLEQSKLDEKNDTYPLFLLDSSEISHYQSSPHFFIGLLIFLVFNFFVSSFYEIYFNKDKWI